VPGQVVPIRSDECGRLAAAVAESSFGHRCEISSSEARC
jgi:hypothetical protein